MSISACVGAVTKLLSLSTSIRDTLLSSCNQIMDVLARILVHPRFPSQKSHHVSHCALAEESSNMARRSSQILPGAASVPSDRGRCRKVMRKRG